MDLQQLTTFKGWFNEYSASFLTPVEEDRRNIMVKKDHTGEVCLNAVRIARDLGLGENDLLLAETIALFHDVGRFPQYREFRTFDDNLSVNHAALGVKVLLEHRVLDVLPKQEQELIVRSVALHNVFQLPDGLDDRIGLFARMIRDADKLDIWRVLVEYYHQSEASRATAVALRLADTPGYSQKVLTSLRDGRMARKENLTSLTDFKLLQLSWVFDLNFAASLRLLVERGHIDAIAEVLPSDGPIEEAVTRVRDYVAGKLRAG